MALWPVALNWLCDSVRGSVALAWQSLGAIFYISSHLFKDGMRYILAIFSFVSPKVLDRGNSLSKLMAQRLKARGA